MSLYHKIQPEDLAFFVSILGENAVFTDEESKNKYGRDQTEDFLFEPEVVLKPSNTQQVSAIVRYCNEKKIALTARGAGTSLSGGGLPLYGGVSLSLERFNKIIEIDKANLQGTVEPGVINEVYQNAVAEHGLFYPPDPASKGSCFLGGNVAHSSGGPRAVKYGTTREYILNLEVVLASGEVIWTGANTLKYSTGYNLTQLMIGSEGTLGIITKIVTRLIPMPKHRLLMLAAFGSAEKACEAVSAIFREGITPSALEFMERDALLITIKYTKSAMQIPDWVNAHLLIEVDGNYMESLQQDCEIINKVLEAYECGEIFFADTDYDKDKLWALRRKVGEAAKSESIYKEEDTVVPRASLPVLLRKVKETGAKYGFQSVCYGHAGDGNLHVNILKGNMSEEQWTHSIKYAIHEIFETCRDLKGTLSGEHGIGYVQREYMPIIMPQTQIDLLKSIKQAFDPNWILNPGKIFEV